MSRVLWRRGVHTPLHEHYLRNPKQPLTKPTPPGRKYPVRGFPIELAISARAAVATGAEEAVASAASGHSAKWQRHRAAAWKAWRAPTAATGRSPPPSSLRPSTAVL